MLSQVFEQTVSADVANAKSTSPILLQDVPLHFVRLTKMLKFTEPDAREKLQFLYAALAGREYTEIKSTHPHANTEGIMNRMESIFISKVTQRQAESEIRKLRISATAVSRRAGVYALVTSIKLFSQNCPVETRTDTALSNILANCVSNVAWASTLHDAMITSELTLSQSCAFLSSLATKEDIKTTNGVHHTPHGT